MTSSHTNWDGAGAKWYMISENKTGTTLNAEKQNSEHWGVLWLTS